MAEYVLGVDNGGTSSKAVVFDLCGREIAQAKENTRLLTPRPGDSDGGYAAVAGKENNIWFGVGTSIGF